MINSLGDSLSYKKKRRNKKAVSVIVGYVILVTIGIIMSIVVYNYLKTYVPAESMECPSDVSLFVKDISCDGKRLIVDLQNNGKFNLYGYFIHAAYDENAKLATVDLSKSLNYSLSNGVTKGSTVFFKKQTNESFKPNEVSKSVFELNPENPITSIELTPIRFQEEDFRKTYVTCGNIKLKEKIICPSSCNCTGHEVYNSTPLCLEEGVDSSTGLSNYVKNLIGGADFYSPNIINYCGSSNGDYHVSAGQTIVFQTPSLPFKGDYNLTLQVLRGSSGQIHEDFSIICGGKTIDFIDLRVSPEKYYNESTICPFEEGVNDVIIKGEGADSVHIDGFQIDGVCPLYC